MEENTAFDWGHPSFDCCDRVYFQLFLVHTNKWGDSVDVAFRDRYKKLGLNIAFYRKARGYTQLQLAEKVGIDRSHMSSIELAAAGVSLDVIFSLCDALDITPKELFDFRT